MEASRLMREEGHPRQRDQREGQHGWVGRRGVFQQREGGREAWWERREAAL